MPRHATKNDHSRRRSPILAGLPLAGCGSMSNRPTEPLQAHPPDRRRARGPQFELMAVPVSSASSKVS
jgi:hypothetical protein